MANNRTQCPYCPAKLKAKYEASHIASHKANGDKLIDHREVKYGQATHS
ncbi:hypothetical protein LCGC14_0363950 [marine sediment metagenome]|uniref:C2H2-type domain-containing protein n=1 Tax=marine sediment metagenome TaxID=412755 RepID=A0A0F9VUB2_9ZZZZ